MADGQWQQALVLVMQAESLPALLQGHRPNVGNDLTKATAIYNLWKQHGQVIIEMVDACSSLF